MAFTIPDKGEGLNDIQSILFQEYLDVLVAGIGSTAYVKTGCAVTAQGTPNMTVAIAAGTVSSGGVSYTVTAGNGTITAADATNPRLDLVVITSAGAIAIRTGAASLNPKPAARVTNDIVLAVVFVPAASTVVAANQITDLRVTASAGSVTSVSGTAPIVVTSGASTPVISLPAATAAFDGYMTAAYASKLDGIQAGATIGMSTDIGANGVGEIALLFNVGASNIGSNGTASGSTLKYAMAYYQDNTGTGGSILSGFNLGASPPGTWRNITGNTVVPIAVSSQGSGGTFQRIS